MVEMEEFKVGLPAPPAGGGVRWIGLLGNDIYTPRLG